MEKSEVKRRVIVTGASRGIGLALVENLAARTDILFDIVLTVRDREAGEKLLAMLRDKFPKTTFTLAILEMQENTSIQSFIKTASEGGKIDILVNNAAYYPKDFKDIAEGVKCIDTNFIGLVDLTKAVLTIMNDHGKIINVSALLGSLKAFPTQKHTARLRDPSLSEADLIKIAKEYREALSNDTLDEGHWPNPYNVSKAFLNLYTRILGKEAEVTRRDIQVYALHPGWVKTDMGGANAPMSLEEGIVCLRFLVDLPYAIEEKYQGKFFDESCNTYQPY